METDFKLATPTGQACNSVAMLLVLLQTYQPHQQPLILARQVMDELIHIKKKLMVN
ncbi:hypothetical protein PtB15_17B438 [Puccinia triticina]|nr:hypothetical protein PtB15_17B438 [Puccinia triticina]